MMITPMANQRDRSKPPAERAKEAAEHFSRLTQGTTIDGDADGARFFIVGDQVSSLPGWQEDVTEARRIEDLPKNALGYVSRVSGLVGRPVEAVLR